MKIHTSQILFLLFSVFISTFSYAQHELRLGIGFPSYPAINEQMHGECDCSDDFRWNGAYNLEYYYQIEKNLKVGASYIFESQFHKISAEMPGYYGWHSYRAIFNTLLFNASRQWINNKIFELYTSMGVGLSYRIEDQLKNTYGASPEPTKTTFRFAYQFTPVGFRIGKKLGVFGELGFGYKGILAGGVNYRF